MTNILNVLEIRFDLFYFYFLKWFSLLSIKSIISKTLRRLYLKNALGIQFHFVIIISVENVVLEDGVPSISHPQSTNSLLLNRLEFQLLGARLPYLLEIRKWRKYADLESDLHNAIGSNEDTKSTIRHILCFISLPDDNSPVKNWNFVDISIRRPFIRKVSSILAVNIPSTL